MTQDGESLIHKTQRRMTAGERWCEARGHIQSKPNDLISLELLHLSSVGVRITRIAAGIPFKSGNLIPT